LKAFKGKRCSHLMIIYAICVFAAELKRRERRVNLILGTLRNDLGILDESPARSQFDCAAKCRSRFECQGANFGFPESGSNHGTCRMFMTASYGTDLSSDPEWNYLAND